jgi:hypothetical protein
VLGSHRDLAGIVYKRRSPLLPSNRSSLSEKWGTIVRVRVLVVVEVRVRVRFVVRVRAT